MPPSDANEQYRRARLLYHEEVARHLLALREALVRHDENLKAHTLMTECVPFFLGQHQETQMALSRTLAQTRHLFDDEALAAYYGNNPHERPFEEQYNGVFTVATADRMGRVHWLVERLAESGGVEGMLDLGCNDGWMLAHLHRRGLVQTGAGVDLSVQSIDRARTRLPGFEWYTDAITNLHQRKGVAGERFDAVSCFEVLEHVVDPVAVMRVARFFLKRGGTFYFSTPLGACEEGWVGSGYEWDVIEPKGHVRAVLPNDLKGWLIEAGFEIDGKLEVFVDVDKLMLVKAVK